MQPVYARRRTQTESFRLQCAEQMTNCLAIIHIPLPDAIRYVQRKPFVHIRESKLVVSKEVRTTRKAIRFTATTSNYKSIKSTAEERKSRSKAQIFLLRLIEALFGSGSCFRAERAKWRTTARLSGA